MRVNSGGFWLPEIALLLIGIMSLPAQADVTYRSGTFVFHVPLELGPVKDKVGRIIRGGLGQDFQRWVEGPCYRMASSSGESDRLNPIPLFQMFKKRADVDVQQCTSPGAPGITYILTDGGLDAATELEVSRLRATTDPGAVTIMHTVTFDGACSWFSVSRRSDEVMTEGSILVDVERDQASRNACLYSPTVHLLGLSDEEYDDFTDEGALKAPGHAEEISLELDLLALFVVTHADALAPDEASDRTAQINRVLTLMYIEGGNR